ncbi:MAG TPA: aldehyde dehydrogenase [Caulobacteraceae bacterium]|jgi:betaine-aldehyde dehydrogenase|nr:aldehyde dehydrogenase [Caulobacteraceae bacterium]
MNVAEAVKLIDIKHLDKLYIGGAWVAPSSDGKIEVVSPVTEEVIFKVAEAREPDMDRAVAAARVAFDASSWPKLSHAERAGWMVKLGAALRARNDELGHAWTNQIGALHALTRTAGNGAAAILDRFAALADTFEWEEEHKPGDGHGRALIVREPVGVVAAVVPWNSPLALACHKLAPAMLAGCTVIVKASPETPLDAYILAEAAESIGLPAGVLGVVVGHRPASEHLIRNPGVDKVAFTGSSAAGKRIASILGERMARYTMELGGKSAAIVLDDYGVDEAVASLTGSLCRLSGQVCAALTRVIVPRERHDDFVDSFAAAMQKQHPGDPYDPASAFGPLAMERQLERVQGYIAKGQEEGATLAYGGGRPAGLNRGFYIEPTLFANVDNHMVIAQEEIFGPVISLIPCDDEADAIRIANETVYGLNGCVLTHDNDRAYNVARQVKAGNVSQGRMRIDFGIAFGGFKQSGIGREGGREGLLPYLEPKTLMLD